MPERITEKYITSDELRERTDKFVLGSLELDSKLLNKILFTIIHKCIKGNLVIGDFSVSI